MGFFNRIFNGPISAWPYTDLQNLNLDWLIGVCKEIKEQWPAEYEKLLKEIENKLGKPVNGGNIGDLLVNIGDGKSQWKPFDNAIASTIIGAVNAWLTAHPEYVTTVQDGAISPAKLDTELYKLYKDAGNVQFFFPNLSSGGYSACSALMVTPTKTVLFDCDAEQNRSAVMEYFTELYNNGIFTNIDYIIISHYHFDHIGNLEQFLENFPHVNCKMYIPISPSGYYVGSVSPELITNYETVVALANYYSVPYYVITEETILNIDHLTNITLFNSDNESYTYYSNNQASYNNYSMVSLVKTGNCYSMFPGDIENVGQERVANNKNLPRLFLYSIHHHGMMNNDYIPYLKSIDPQYCVIPTSYNRMQITGRSGMMHKLTNSIIGSTAYDSYSFSCNSDGGIITHGVSLYYPTDVNTSLDIYVNNEYTGNIHDGSISHPYTSISEAFSWCNEHRNLHYTIKIIKTDTTYEGALIRDYPYEITISGVNNPLIKYFYFNNCENINIVDLSIVDGYENRPSSGAKTAIVALNSKLTIRRVNMEGTTIATNSYAFEHDNANIRLTTVTISNYYRGCIESGINPSSIQASSCTFTNIETYLFTIRQCLINIWDGNTFSNINKIILGNMDRMIPFVIKPNLISTVAPLCTASAISQPIYLSAENPVVIISNSKVYNLLTGQEIT